MCAMPGDEGAAPRRRSQSPFALDMIPKMDCIMMGGVIRLNREHLLKERINRFMRIDRDSRLRVVPDCDSEKRLGFDVLRVFVNDRFEILHVLFRTVLSIAVVREIGVERLNPHPVVRAYVLPSDLSLP